MATSPSNFVNTQSDSWDSIAQAIASGNIDAIHEKCQKYNWINNSYTASFAMKLLDKAQKRKRKPLSRERITAVAVALGEYITDSYVWHKTCAEACRHVEMEMVWPGLVRALNNFAPQPLDSVVRTALQTYEIPFPEWGRNALQRHPADQEMEGGLFWMAAHHPDPTILVQLMEHPARPTHKNILTTWNGHSEEHPLRMDDVRKYLDLKDVLTVAIQLAQRIFAIKRDIHDLESTLQFWWQALTTDEQTAWLNQHKQDVDRAFLLPIVIAWDEQKTLQAMKPTSENHGTMRARL